MRDQAGPNSETSALTSELGTKEKGILLGLASSQKYYHFQKRDLYKHLGQNDPLCFHD